MQEDEDVMPRRNTDSFLMIDLSCRSDVILKLPMERTGNSQSLKTRCRRDRNKNIRGIILGNMEIDMEVSLKWAEFGKRNFYWVGKGWVED